MKSLNYFIIAIFMVMMSAETIAGNHPAMPQNVIWQMTINNIDPIPQPSGAQIAYRVQLQCSALSENEALNTELRFPGQGLTYFRLPVAHPSIESFSYNDATDEWVIDFQDVIFAGTSIEFDIIARTPNHVTPDGTTFVIDGTLSSSNAATVSESSTGEWTATANLGIEKYLQFGPDTDALLDIPVRYYLYPCDPSFNPSPDAYGHAYLDNWTLVDILPEGTIYNSSSGNYNSSDHSVTWSGTEFIKNEDCDFSGATDYWVEVTFPSSTFGENSDPLVLSATNTATFEGYPIGQSGDPSQLQSDTDQLLHSFSAPNPIGTHDKNAVTPYVGVQDITYEGDSAQFHISVHTSSNSGMPYYFKIIDPLPCLDYTPNSSSQYESPIFNGPICTNMAYQPDDYIQLALIYDYLTISDPETFVLNNPTIPLGLVTTNGDTVSIDASYATDYYGQLQYRVAWDEIQAFIGTGVGVASVIWDSETIDVRVSVTPSNNAQAARLSLYGSVADDTATYPMQDQYRVRNYAYFFIDAIGEENAMGAIQDDVTIIRRASVIEMSKDMSETTGLVTLTMNSNGEPFTPADSLIFTDLLPLGYTFESESQQFFNINGGTWYWSTGQGDSNGTNYPELDAISVRNFIEVEVIDDYNGTGRQLVRATFLPPPVPDVWEKMKSLRFSFYLEQQPMNYSAVNYFQVFPTNPTTEQNLLYQYGFTTYPVPAFSNDPYDLDGDGKTTGDAFGEDNYVISPTSTVVDIRSFKAVKGDLDTEFDPFPAIAGITNQGGTADFQINIQNIGGIGLDSLVVYDILPHIGDTGLSETQINNPRGSTFDVTFTGMDMSTLPMGTVVEYSTSTNPCRDELTTGAAPFPSDCINDWTTTIPTPIGSVKALRFTFPSGEISEFIPGEAFAIEYGVTYPAGIQPNDVAWNNFAYAAKRVDDDTEILPSEAPKVGLAIPMIDLNVMKSVNPVTNFVGDTTLYTIILDHEGNVTTDGVYTMPVGRANDITLVDNFIAQGLTIVPGTSTIFNSFTNSDDGAIFNETDGTITIPEMGPSDNYTITYLAYSSTEGTITNAVEVMSHPGVDDVDSTPGNGDNGEDDYSEATAMWLQPEIQLQALVETYSGSGVFIEADESDGLYGTYTSGQPINYQFVISNTGSAHLYNLELVDTLVGFECNETITVLEIGETITVNCTWQYGFSDSATPYVNQATISADAFIGSTQQSVSDTNTAQVLIIPCNMTITATGNEANCESGIGSIGITATDGTAPYIIEWTGVSSGNTAGQNMPYTISNLQAGTYNVTVTDRNGCKDESTVAIANSNQSCASIGNFVWIDENQNGTQDTDEPGISGITVTLLNASGQIVASSSTDAYGNYQLSNLTPGDYQVQFTPPTNYVFTNMGTGGNNDSDVNPTTGMTNMITVLAGENNDNIDAGLIYNTNNDISIGDFVWLDDGNGIQDGSEPGISGVIVTLYNNTDGSIASVTQTDESGHYQFTEVNPGNYYIGFTAPIGYNFTTQTNGTDTGSDASPTTGETADFVIGSESITSIDAGFVAQATDETSLGSTVWFDTNNNGIQDANEAGVAGITVHLYTEDGTLEATTTTNILGNYTFNSLIEGDYYLEFDISSQTGYNFVTADVGINEALDSDVNNANGANTTATISLVAGVNNMSLDAGIYSATAPTSAIGDYVWFDENADGVQDSNEMGVPGITVYLYNDSGTHISTTITNNDGLYTFPNLADGDYGVLFGNIPENHVFSPFNSPLGDFETDSDVDDFGSMAVTISGGDNLNSDAGIYLSITENGSSSIGNLVFYDYNSNGIQDSDEVGVAGVTVYLYEISNTSTPIRTVNTDGQGNYVFNDLPEGKYIVGFELPSSAYQFTTSDVGNDDNIDSDILTINGLIGYTDDIQLSEGEDELSVDAGIQHQTPSGVIGDFVWFDANNNAVQDSNEIGVGGVTVTLFDGSGNFVAAVSTNPTGAYAFYGLADGNYTVRFTNFPTGMDLAPQTNNTTDGSDADPITGMTNTIAISSSSSNMTDIDAGLQGAVAVLGDYIWYDANANGLQDTDEVGIHGATVTTYQNGVYISAITDENGFYSFPNLAPDFYSAAISTLPDGLDATIKGTGVAPETDSDLDPESGFTNVVNLSAGEVNQTVDVGYITPANGSLGNYAWFDNITTDGLQETGETGVAGMTISLYNDDGELTGTAISDVDGYYLFNGLPDDDYSIKVSTMPKDYVLTYQDASIVEDGMDSDADRDLNTSTNYTVNGNHLRNIDVGVAKLNIQGIAWYDTDNNGQREVSEILLEGVEVKLFLLDSTIVDSTVTNASGFYEFLEMDDEDYFIGFNETTNVAGFEFVSGTEPEMNEDSDITDANDSDIDPYSRRTPNFNLRLGETKRNIDAGFVTVALPVELIHFTGKNKDCDNILYWATATEENNSHFIIETSQDGKDFEALGYVEGNGNSTERVDYTFVHENVRKQYNYYRLKQVDFDGTSTHTEALILETNCELVSNAGVIVYPNPTLGNVNIELYSEIDGKAEVSIVDVTGKILEEMTIELNAGITVKEIDMSSYMYGAYMFLIEANGMESSVKVIKAD